MFHFSYEAYNALFSEFGRLLLSCKCKVFVSDSFSVKQNQNMKEKMQIYVVHDINKLKPQISEFVLLF